MFQGYSFIAPSVLFGKKNAITDDIFAEKLEIDRPGEASLVYASLFEVRCFCFIIIFSWISEEFLRKLHKCYSFFIDSSINS